MSVSVSRMCTRSATAGSASGPVSERASAAWVRMRASASRKAAVSSGIASPLLKVVSVQPNNVGEGSVSLSKPFSVRVILGYTVSSQHIRPATSFDRIEKDCDSVLGRKSNHGIRSPEVGFVRRCEVSRLLERSDAIVRRRISSTCGVGVAKEVNPNRVESCGMAIGEVSLRVLERDVDDEGLWRVPDDQEGDAARIH